MSSQQSSGPESDMAPQQVCSVCGESYLAPVELHHAEDECLAPMTSRTGRVHGTDAELARLRAQPGRIDVDAAIAWLHDAVGVLEADPREVANAANQAAKALVALGHQEAWSGERGVRLKVAAEIEEEFSKACYQHPSLDLYREAGLNTAATVRDTAADNADAVTGLMAEEACLECNGTGTVVTGYRSGGIVSGDVFGPCPACER